MFTSSARESYNCGATTLSGIQFFAIGGSARRAAALVSARAAGAPGRRTLRRAAHVAPTIPVTRPSSLVARRD